MTQTGKSLGKTAKKIAINLGLVLASLLLCLVIGEIAIRTLSAIGYMQAIDPAAHKANIKKNRKLNAKLIKSENPVLYLEYDPNNRHINNAGHRGKDIQLEKPANVFRIAVLGDSIAYGYGVPLKDTFTTLLQQQLNETGYAQKIEVLNFAVSGYGTEAELELYKTKVQHYQPDLVLLTYTLNDPIPPQFLYKSVGSARKKAKTFQKIASQSQFLGWLVNTWNRATKQFRVKANYKTFYNSEELWSAVQTSVAELKQLTDEQNTQLAAVIFPLLLPYDDYPMMQYHEMVAAEFDKHQIPHLDLFSTYSQYGASELKHNDEDTTHPNALGHQLATDAMAEFLQQERLIPQ